MYGHCYTPATISKIAADVSDQVEQFHKRPVAKRYAVIFCDAMYVNLRRDSVAKESIHVLLGITPEGYKDFVTRQSSRSNIKYICYIFKQKGAVK